MDLSEQTLSTFQTRARQLVLRFKQLEKENEELYGMVDRNEKAIAKLKAELAQKSMDYDSLKMARMIGISDGDIEATKARLSKLIRDVNKCIAVLTEKKEG